MSFSQTIALDAMGGDFGPSVVVPAAALSLEKIPSLNFIFFGDEVEIKPHLAKNPDLQKVSSIHHTDEMISNEDKPSVAVRKGRKSSMKLAINAVKTGEAQSIVSAGNTGALMALSKMVLRSLPGVNRPAIASRMPSNRGDTVMLDLGANLICDAEALIQFAILGAIYAKAVKGIDMPTVGLLNIGSEEMKGPENIRMASTVLSNIKFPGTYSGFVEGNDIMNGVVDVLVMDGFTGNVALKVTEGVADFLTSNLKKSFKSSLLSKVGALLAAPSLKRMKQEFDPRYYNGGMFLGLNGICVKSHGGMDAYGFSRAILVAANLVENGYNDYVLKEMEQLMEQDDFVAQIASSAAEGGI